MYTRTTCPTHIVQEVIDNAADEALAGFAKKISVAIRADGVIEVSDNGRGIPVEIHPEEGRPAVELVFCKLHAGGKFNKKESGNAYRFSGGLHGVGVSVTNALSIRLEVEIKRGGGVHHIAFGAGFVTEPLSRIGDCGQRNTGTTVRIQPDPKYFDSPKINLAQLEHLLRSKAVLMPNVTVELDIEGQEKKVWCYQNGMADYLNEMMVGTPVAPIFVGEKYVETRQRFRRRRRRHLGAGLVRGRRRQAGKLRQPDPDARWRHPRSRPQSWRLRSDQDLRRTPRHPAGQSQTGAGRRLRPHDLPALGQGARPAVPGPDQGKTDQPRRLQAGHPDGARPLRAVAQQPRRFRQEDRRTGRQGGAEPHEIDAEGREEEILRASPPCPAS